MKRWPFERSINPPNKALKQNRQMVLLFFLLGILIVIALAVMWFENVEMYVSELLGITSTDLSSAKFEVLKSIGIVIGGILIAWQAWASYRRAKAMEDTVGHTEQGQRQERLKNAIEHLGDKSESVRMGGAYELFYLAQDTTPAESRQPLLDILCAHIRTKTGEKTGEDNYQITCPSKPSVEIQSLLNLLFREENKTFEGLHIDLQDSWLNGADLREALLSKAILTGAHLEGADLRGARLQWADFQHAHLKEALLQGARLQGALLQHAQLQGGKLEGAWLQFADLQDVRLNNACLQNAQMHGANLEQAQLRGARLGEARLQGADLWDAQLQGANLWDAWLQGADLWNTQLQMAFLRGAQLQGANLWKTQLQGADLEQADLRGAFCHYDQFRGLFYVTEPGQVRPAIRERRLALQEEFKNRMRKRIGKTSDLSKVIFEGGLTQEAVDNIVKNYPNLVAKEAEQELRKMLQPHIDRPPSHNPPENIGLFRKPYTEKGAEHWIAEYEKDVREAEWGDLTQS